MENATVDDPTTKLAFKFLFGQVEHICRLCLSSTVKGINIDNTVDLQTPYCNNTISYQTMLYKLNVPNECEMPRILCKICAKLTVNCYLFQKLRQFSNEKWLRILQLLKTSLLKLDNLQSEVKSVYLVLNNSENLVLKSNKSYVEKPDKVVILKGFVRSCQKYLTEGKNSNDYVCNECNNSLGTQYSLNKHMTLEHKMNNTCKDCLQTYSTLNNLQIHTEKVHSPKKFHCDRCSGVFETTELLRSHIKAKHTTFTCKLCDTIFLSKRRLIKHMVKHKTRTCPSCNKKYKNIHVFQNHIKRCGKVKETQEKYICDYCNKCYKRKNGLRSHLKTDHGFGNVLACNWCYKKFDAVSRLKNHIVKHTKEKNFHCTQCNGQFVSYAALVYHTRLHTGERPFPCDMCGESFLSASRRMEHKKRKHIGPTKECTLCDMKFITTFQLRKHFHRHFNPSSKLFITKDDLIELKKRGKIT